MDEKKATVTFTVEQVRYLLRLTEQVQANFRDLDREVPIILRKINNELITGLYHQ